MKMKEKIEKNHKINNAAKKVFSSILPLTAAAVFALNSQSAKASEMSDTTLYITPGIKTDGTNKEFIKLALDKDTLNLKLTNGENIGIDSVYYEGKGGIGPSTISVLKPNNSFSFTVDSVINVVKVDTSSNGTIINTSRSDTLRYIVELTNKGMTQPNKYTAVNFGSDTTIIINSNSDTLNLKIISSTAKFFIPGVDKNFNNLSVDTLFVDKNSKELYYKDSSGTIKSVPTKTSSMVVDKVVLADSSSRFTSYSISLIGKYCVITAKTEKQINENYVFDLDSNKIIGMVFGDINKEIDQNGNIKNLITLPKAQISNRGSKLSGTSVQIPDLVLRVALQIKQQKQYIQGKDQKVSGVIEAEKYYLLYPNPANNYIKISDQSLMEVIVVNLASGQEIKKQVYNGQVDISDLPNGPYAVFSQKQNRIEHLGKFIKQ